MPKYWGKQIFSLGSFPEVGQKQKIEKKEEEEKLNDGDNNGQAMHGTHKAAWVNFVYTDCRVSMYYVNTTTQATWHP